MRAIDLVIIVIYLIGIFSVGLISRKKIKTVDDYLSAGNRFSTFSLVGTLIASLYGAGTIMGVGGGVYSYGAGILWNYVGVSIGFILFALVFARPIRNTQKKTMAEIISGKFGRVPHFLVGLFAALYTFCIMAIGVSGLSRMLTYICGGTMNIMLATVICTLVAVLLTALGGLYSVIWTDTIQFVIMVLALVVIAPYVVIHNVGSLSAINSALGAVGGTLTNPAKNVSLSYIMLCTVTMCLAVPCDPTVPQRALAGKSISVVKRSAWISSILSLIIGLAVTVVCGGGLVLIPNIKEIYGTTESVLPVLMITYFPPVLAGIGISAMIAAVLSTITSMLLVGTTHLVYDCGKSLFPRTDDSVFKKFIPYTTIMIGLTVMWASLKIPSIGSVLYFAFSLCGAAFLFPMLATLYWKKTSKVGVSLGVLLGAMSVIFLSLANISAPGGDPVYLGMAVSFAAILFGSFLFPEKSESEIAE